YFPSVFRSGDVINYITTICTHPDFRGRKLASQLYEFIEKSLPNTVKAECVSTRTWNTNIEHIRLLEKRGYKLTCTLHEDRRDEDGTMLDTVYYCKRTEN
ncbi:MAG: GNAT family N-acetyltransferase, partial [Bacteroidales bacterium]|nr:GNAT family N-acetyltransferase [Bacteroidales bacterium]